MGSLISPGSTTPIQAGFVGPWPGVQGWQSSGQNSFGFGTPHEGQIDQTGFDQNGPQDYVPFEADDELFTVDDSDMFPMTSDGQQPNLISGASTGVTPHQPHAQSGSSSTPTSSAPQVLPQPRVQTLAAIGPPTPTKSPTASESAKRAAELRTKLLLAKKAGAAGSTQTKVILRPTEMTVNTKENVENPLNRANGKPIQPPRITSSADTAQSSIEKDTNDRSTSEMPGQILENAELSADLDNLFAHARNAADGKKPEEVAHNNTNPAGKVNGESAKPQVMNAMQVDNVSVSEERPTPNKRIPSSDLSEGEIRGDSTPPTSASQPVQPDDSREAREKAAEAEEKLIRQSDVNKSDQPLKKADELPSKNSWTDTSKTRRTAKKVASPEASEYLGSRPLRSPVSTTQNRFQSDGPNTRVRYDKYRPDPRARRDPDRELLRYPDSSVEDRSWRPSTTQTNPGDTNRYARDDLDERRKRLSDFNARAAAEYKKALNAKQARQPASHERRDDQTPHSSIDSSQKPRPSIDEDVQMVDSAPTIHTRPPGSTTGQQQLDGPLVSRGSQPAENHGQDVSDWLELTEYYDIQYRQRKLARFRKKRDLDAQRAELEREEQLELEERSFLARAQAALPNASSPKVMRRASVPNVKMPPPVLPLREANDDSDIKIKDSVIPAAHSMTQPSASALKRQHTDDDVEARRMQPVEKMARTAVNGYSANNNLLTSSVTAQAESISTKGGPSSLEGRISRDDDRYAARYRPRSRSPVYRRRSPSPQRRRNSRSPEWVRPPNSNALLPEKPFCRTCHNCGKPGHFVSQCPEGIRDGKDRPLLPSGISPNYRGRNPIRRGGYNSTHDRAHGGDSRSRYSSVGHPEEGESGNKMTKSIGSADLNLGAGGQSRSLR